MRISADNMDMQPPATMLNTQRFAAGRLGYARSHPRPSVPIGQAGQTALEFATSWASKSSGIGRQAWEFFERFFRRRGRSGRIEPRLEKQWLVRRRPAFSRLAAGFPAPLRSGEVSSAAFPFPSRSHSAAAMREIVTQRTILSFVTQFLPLRLPLGIQQGSTKALAAGFPTADMSRFPADAKTNPWRDHAPLIAALTLSRPPVPQASWLGASPSAPPPAQLLPATPAAAGLLSSLSPHPFAVSQGTLPRPLFTLLPELIYGVRTFAAPGIPRIPVIPRIPASLDIPTSLYSPALPGSLAGPSSPSVASGLGQSLPPAAGPGQDTAPRSSRSRPVTQLLAVTAALALLQILPAQALSIQAAAQTAPLAGKLAAFASSLPRREMTLTHRAEQALTLQTTWQIPARSDAEQTEFRSSLRPRFDPEAKSSLILSGENLPYPQVFSKPQTQEATGTRWTPSALTALVMPHLFTRRSREPQAAASTRPLTITASVTTAATKMSVLLSRHSPEADTGTGTGPWPSAKPGSRLPDVSDFNRKKNDTPSLVTFRKSMAALPVLTHALLTRFQQVPAGGTFAQAGENSREALPEIQQSQTSPSGRFWLAQPVEAAGWDEQSFFRAPAAQHLLTPLPLAFLLAANRPPAPNLGGDEGEAGHGFAGALLAAPSALTAPSFRIVSPFPAPVPPELGVRGLLSAPETRSETWDTAQLIEETISTEFQPQLLSLVRGFLSRWQNTVLPAVTPLHQVAAASPALTETRRGAFSATPETAASADFEDAVSLAALRLTGPGQIQTLPRSLAGQALPLSLRTPQSAIFLEAQQDRIARMTDSSLVLKSSAAERGVVPNRFAAGLGTTPSDLMPFLRPAPRSEIVSAEAASAARPLSHLPLPMRFPESTADVHRASPDTRLLPDRGKTAALPSPRPVSMTLPVPAPLAAPDEAWAIQRVVSGGQSAAATVSQAAQQDTNLASQEKGAAANDVHLLANEVWSLLKRRLETEAERIGRR